MHILFLFTDTAATEIYTLSLHDALPISFAPLIDAPSRSPESGERPRKADALLGAPLVEKPLHRRQQIVVLLLELREQCLAVETLQPRAGEFREIEKRFRRSRIHKAIIRTLQRGTVTPEVAASSLVATAADRGRASCRDRKGDRRQNRARGRRGERACRRRPGRTPQRRRRFRTSAAAPSREAREPGFEARSFRGRTRPSSDRSGRRYCPRLPAIVKIVSGVAA